jgi:hypothetical protein
MSEYEPCPACGDPADYCQGHGPSGDPRGYALLTAHDAGDHSRCARIADCEGKFRPLHGEWGVALEMDSWPEGMVEDSFIVVEGAWKNVRTGGYRSDGKAYVHPAPEIHDHDEAEAALRRLWANAWTRYDERTRLQ